MAMVRRVSLSFLLGLSLLKLAFAATSSLPSNVSDMLGLMIKYLGPQGPDFLMAFGIVTAVVYMAISKVPAFTTNAAGKSGAALFAILGGLSTAFYVYMQKIPFLNLIGPYFLFLVALLLGLMGIQVIGSLRQGKDLLSGLALYGVGAIMIGALTLFFSPTLAMLGIFIIFIGIIMIIVGGVSMFGRLSGTGLFKATEKETGKLLGNIEYDFSENVRGQTQIERAESSFIKKAQTILNQVVSSVQGGNYQGAISLLTELRSVTGAELAVVKQEVATTKDLKNQLRLKINPKIYDLETKEARAKHERRADTILAQLDKRLQQIEVWRQKVEAFDVQFDNEGLKRIQACITYLSVKNYTAFMEEIPHLQALYARMAQTVYSELNVSGQYGNLMIEFETILKKKESADAASLKLETELKAFETKAIEDISALEKYIAELEARSPPKKKHELKYYIERLAAAKKMVVILKNNALSPKQKLAEIRTFKVDTLNVMERLQYYIKTEPAAGYVADLAKRMQEIETLEKEASQLE